MSVALFLVLRKVQVVGKEAEGNYSQLQPKQLQSR